MFGRRRRSRANVAAAIAAYHCHSLFLRGPDSRIYLESPSNENGSSVLLLPFQNTERLPMRQVYLESKHLSTTSLQVQ
jgi:hypothetical protein